MALSESERVIRARIAAKTRASQGGYNADTGKRGQAGLLAKFEKQVDPDGTLDPAERARRAEYARQAHMDKLALASAKARRLRSAASRKEAA